MSDRHYVMFWRDENQWECPYNLDQLVKYGMRGGYRVYYGLGRVNTFPIQNFFRKITFRPLLKPRRKSHGWEKSRVEFWFGDSHTHRVVQRFDNDFQMMDFWKRWQDFLKENGVQLHKFK